MIHMEYYLVVSTIMMFAGIYGFFTRRNTLAILISVELMLNATDINFAVFNRFLFPGGMEGYFFALFSIAISAAETAIAIAIMINIYRNLRSIQVRNLDDLKWCRVSSPEELRVSCLETKSFIPGKQEFHAGETRVSHRGNKGFIPGNTTASPVMTAIS